MFGWGSRSSTGVCTNHIVGLIVRFDWSIDCVVTNSRFICDLDVHAPPIHLACTHQYDYVRMDFRLR